MQKDVSMGRGWKDEEKKEYFLLGEEKKEGGFLRESFAQNCVFREAFLYLSQVTR